MTNCAIAVLNNSWLLVLLIKVMSIPAKSRLAPMTSKPAGLFTIASDSDTPSSSTSAMVSSNWFLSTPVPLVALPCGSKSISSTCLRLAAKLAVKFTAVVVLPTPPF